MLMKHSFRWKTLIIASSLVLPVILVMDLNRRLDTMNQLSVQVATVRVEGTRVVETQVGLETQLAYVGSDDAVGKWALEQGQPKPDETLIRILPGENLTPTVTPTPEADSTPEVKNWQVWWELFFGN